MSGPGQSHSRRGVLVAGLSGAAGMLLGGELVSGCSIDLSLDRDGSPRVGAVTVAPPEDLALLAAAVEAERRLLDLYLGLRHRHGAAGRLVDSTVHDHRRHLEVLRLVLRAGQPSPSTPITTAATTPTTSSPSASTPSTSPGHRGPNGDARIARTAHRLARVESRASTDRVGAADAARSGDLARLLASIAASEAQHSLQWADLSGRVGGRHGGPGHRPGRHGSGE